VKSTAHRPGSVLFTADYRIDAPSYRPVNYLTAVLVRRVP
jgi:hypothetical protein